MGKNTRCRANKNRLGTDELKVWRRLAICLRIRLYHVSIAKLAPTKLTRPIRQSQYYFFWHYFFWQVEKKLWRETDPFAGEIRDQLSQVRAISTVDRSQHISNNDFSARTRARAEIIRLVRDADLGDHRQLAAIPATWRQAIGQVACVQMTKDGKSGLHVD